MTSIKLLTENFLNQFKYIVFLTAVFTLAGCKKNDSKFIELPASEKPKSTDLIPIKENKPSPPIVESARNQIGVTLSYDPAYTSLTYPGGDVPLERGVCTDVIIRALRDSHGLDLQKLVHEDMKKAFTKYPKIWGLTRPDKNIDHRRVPNLQCYFERKGYKVRGDKSVYKPGDLVTCLVGNRPHIMIVSDRALNGVPLVIHNIGSGTVEDNSLHLYKKTGHYRIVN